jgi:hypothetical protein
VAKKNMLGGDFKDVLDGVNSDFEKQGGEWIPLP